MSTLEHTNRRALREAGSGTGSTASQMVTIAAGMGEGAEGEAVVVDGVCPATWSPAVSAAAPVLLELSAGLQQINVWWDQAAARAASVLDAAASKVVVKLSVEKPAEGGLGFIFRKLPVESQPVVSTVKEESAAVRAVLSAWHDQPAAARLLVPGEGLLSAINGQQLDGQDRAACLGQLKQACGEAAVWPIELEFEIAARPAHEAVIHPPALPRCFTGESRLGTADGRNLCQGFGLKRFTKECDDNSDVGVQMYASLLNMWHRAPMHEHTLHTWRTTC